MNYEFELKVTGVKGHCRAGHKEGDIMKVSPLNAGICVERRFMRSFRCCWR